MIICQPRFSVVLLISAFLFSSYVLTGIWLYSIFTSPAPSIIWLFVACLLLSLLLFFTIRLAVGYISIQAGKGKIVVYYKLLGKQKHYDVTQVTSLDEIKIDTYKNKRYRQLILVFDQQKISINDQVYAGYDSLKKYLNENRNSRKPKTPRR